MIANQTKPRKDSPKLRQKKLQKLAGPDFLAEMDSSIFQMLLKAYGLTHFDASIILRRSISFVEKLVRAEVAFSADIQDQIRLHFGCQCLTRQNPKGLPLVELTPRSLTLMRKGQELTNLALGKITGLNADQLGRFQNGKTGISRDHMQVLGQALKIRFFMT